MQTLSYAKSYMKILNFPVVFINWKIKLKKDNIQDNIQDENATENNSCYFRLV